MNQYQWRLVYPLRGIYQTIVVLNAKQYLSLYRAKLALRVQRRADCKGICPARSRSRECIDPAIALECIESEAVFEARSVEVLLDRSFDLLMLVYIYDLRTSPGKSSEFLGKVGAECIS